MADFVKGRDTQIRVNAQVAFEQYQTAKVALTAITSASITDLASAKQAILTLKTIDLAILEAFRFLGKEYFDIEG